MNKEEIINTIKNIISNKITNFETLIAETRTSNNDTKSSMGDKYETGREMLQQEINNLQIQLNEVLKQQNAVDLLPTKQSVKSEKGALVQTDKGIFFISVSLGNTSYNQSKIFCISPDSPLAKALENKKEGETITLNNITQKILKIW